MAKGWSYVSGDWWITCDSCGKKIKASESRKRWDGFIVCQDDYEERQPLDFIRARVDKISVPEPRPIPTLIFTDVVYACTIEGKSAIATTAVAGCSVAGTTEGMLTYPVDSAISGIAVTGIAISGVDTIYD